MKVSASGASSRSPGLAAPGFRTWPLVIAGAWFLAHLPSLAPALEDIDSINFALGLHDFDPAKHQPHPPGYPVFIALGRLALAVIHLVAPGLASLRADALALAIWSGLGGALAIVAAAYVFRELSSEVERRDRVARWAVVFMALTPLFWMTGLRPMSDMFGLGVALAAQALLLRGVRVRGALVAGALVAGLAAGVRSQTVPLTLPLFLYALFEQRRQGISWLLTRPVAAMAAAGLAWGIPLILLTGGIGGYLRALGTQAGEDFAWVDMLWAHPTPRAIAFALFDSFVLPFAEVPTGVVMLGIAGIGALRLLVRDRRALFVLAVAFVPYAVFHLLFQEAANLRYATPLVVPLACLVASAVCAVEAPHARLQEPRVRGRRSLFAAAPVALLLLFPAVLVRPAALLHGLGPIPITAGVIYGGEVHPAFRAIADMKAEAARRRPAAIFAHYALRRPLQAEPTDLPIVEPTRSYEWLGMEDYWLKGGRNQVWFLADPKRTDLALIDPQARKPRWRREYLWSVGDRPELMGTRPMAVTWYRFDPPGWFAAEGWELTPETAGIARASGKDIRHQPVTAYIRRRDEPMRALIAGRHVGPATVVATTFELALDGAVVDSWRLDPATDGTDFFHLLNLPAGIPPGAGEYARLTIRARAEAPGVPTPDVAVQQFDIQPATVVMFGFDAGWYQAEYDNATGRAWRWTSDRSVMRIMAPGAVSLRLRGESPLKYFDAPPTVRILAGDRALGVFRPDGDFDWRIPVPAEALAAADGRVTMVTDRVYLPGQAEGTADARRLGLRIFEAQVEPAVGP